MSDESLGWSYISTPFLFNKTFKNIQKGIFKNHLHEYGLEKDFHVTVKYGFTFEDSRLFFRIACKHFPGKVFINKLDLFENEDFDVLKFSLISESLTNFWKDLSALPNKDEKDFYNPHITLAYLKRGFGKRYVKETVLDGIEFTYNTIYFEDLNEKRYKCILDW